MKEKEIITLFVLIHCFFLTTNGQTLKTAKYAGVYSFGKDVEKGPVGSVTVYPETDSTVLFYIDICRGAPSYNLGQRYSRLKIKNGSAIYFAKENYDEKGCKWQVTIKNQVLTIQTLNGCYECGFGGNVYADNKYVLINKTIPKYFIDGHNDKIHFGKTSPEEYNHADISQAWPDSLINRYILYSENKLIRLSDKNKIQETWLFDKIIKTDTAKYFVFQIGHDVTDAGEINKRFVTDGWIYIDSLANKIYEYDLSTDRATKWDK